MPWIADAELVGRLVDPYVEAMPMNQYTADVPDSFLVGVRAMCAQLRCAPLDLLGCWMNESGLHSTAQNKGALAVGFFQAMPSTLRGMGFRGDSRYTEPSIAYAAAREAGDKAAMRALDQALSDAFARLGHQGQLPWAARYYAPHVGKLVDGAACYAANFVPAWIGHAAEEGWVICSSTGRSDGGLPPTESEEWFRENATLDVDGDGAVTMGDLARAIARATKGPRWGEILARVALLEDAPPDTQRSTEVAAELAALAAEPPTLDEG